MLTAALMLWLCVGLATPAAAHGAGTTGAGSNFRTLFTDPAADCLTWTVLNDDGYLSLRSRCPGTVTVLGYEDEPYLEFSEAGVRENRNSPASYLNRDPNANVKVPPSANANAPPDWVNRSGLSTYRWHDHRTHWMSSRPPETDASSALVNEWSIPLRFDDDGTGEFVYLLEARGELWYYAPLGWWIPITFAAVPVVGALTIGLLRVPTAGGDGRVRRWPELAGPLAALVAFVGALTAADVTDDVFAAGQTAGGRATDVAIASVVLGLCAWAAWRARRGDDLAFTLLVAAGIAVAWVYGWPHRNALSASQLRTALPDLLVRFTAALQLLIVVPCIIGFVAWRWTQRRTTPATGPDADAAGSVDGVGAA